MTALSKAPNHRTARSCQCRRQRRRTAFHNEYMFRREFNATVRTSCWPHEFRVPVASACPPLCHHWSSLEFYCFRALEQATLYTQPESPGEKYYRLSAGACWLYDTFHEHRSGMVPHIVYLEKASTHSYLLTRAYYRSPTKPDGNSKEGPAVIIVTSKIFYVSPSYPLAMFLISGQSKSIHISPFPCSLAHERTRQAYKHRSWNDFLLFACLRLFQFQTLFSRFLVLRGLSSP